MSSMPRTPRLAIALLVLVAGPCVSQSRHLKQEVAGNFVGCSVFPGQPDGLSQELLASAPKDEETLFGFFLPANGSDAPVPMHGPLQVTLVRNIEPDLAAAYRRMAPVHGRRWRTMFPAVTWCNGRWLTVTRLEDQTGAHLWKSGTYLVTQTYNSSLQPVTPVRILGTAAFFNGVDYSGLEDPRVVLLHGRLYVQGNVHVPDPVHHAVCRIGLADAISSDMAIMDIPGQTLYKWEKSWAAYQYGNSLRYLYTIDPVVDLECSLEGTCKVAYHERLCPTPPCNNVPPRGEEPEANFLRGGTSLASWKDSEYFVGFAHSNFKDHHMQHYGIGAQVVPNVGMTLHRMHLIIYNAKSHRIIYVSGPVVVGPNITSALPPTRGKGIVQDPTSVVFLPEGHAVLGMNYDDSLPLLISVKGLVPIIEGAIEMDRKAIAGGAPGTAVPSHPLLPASAAEGLKQQLAQGMGKWW